MESDNYEWVLAISFAAHDGSITLLKDGKVELFIKEERISRDKHDSRFPFNCLQTVKECTRRLDKVLVANQTSNNLLNLHFHLEKLHIIKDVPITPEKIDEMNYGVNIERSLAYIQPSDEHHLFHAACGFYTSGFDEAICLVVDGWGSATDSWYDISEHGLPFPIINADESTTIYHASFPDNFELINKISIYDSTRRDGLHDLQNWNIHSRLGIRDEDVPSVKQFFSTIPNTNVTSHMDIGVMYGVTSCFLGFSSMDCGKTMGLSAYGKEDDSLPPFFIEGTSISNKNLFTQSRTIDEINYDVKDVPITPEKRANFAYKMQKEFERVYEERIQFIDDNYDCKNIVLSGGCALNVVNNASLVEKFPHMNFFVDPIPNDAGQSLGYALLWNYQNGPICTSDGDDLGIEKVNLDNIFLGPKYSKEELRERILEAI